MKNDLYLLSEDDIAHFDTSLAADPVVRRLIDDAAEEWRRRSRPKFTSAEACRHALLAHSALLGARLGLEREWRIPDLPALARYLCRWVEIRVAELDAAEGEDGEAENEV
jgi:hypothetical protein